MSRRPWPRNFPPVLAHCAWEAPSGFPILPDHPKYWPAKKRRNTSAALVVCEAVAREETLEQIWDIGFGNPSPIIAVPALTLNETQNVLAIGYAKWLADEMGWEVARETFQAKTVSRDFNIDGWFRLVNQPAFYGKIEEGRRYIVADDVCTMGGTIAELRGYIESQGGCVICATTLATRDGNNVKISLAAETLRELNGALNGQLAKVVRTELGYDISCLTEAEGQFLLRCSSIDALRAGIDGARDA